uniref:Uncharacterized protein n=1 Tax=Anguilla anguilla TaxID=7936 RepID=A0A0E9VY40_ANGAN
MLYCREKKERCYCFSECH